MSHKSFNVTRLFIFRNEQYARQYNIIFRAKASDGAAYGVGVFTVQMAIHRDNKGAQQVVNQSGKPSWGGSGIT